MTQTELDALPELPSPRDFGQILTTDREGNKIAIPVAPKVVVLWVKEDEPHHVIDDRGIRWDVGWYEGIRYKRVSVRQDWSLSVVHALAELKAGK